VKRALALFIVIELVALAGCATQQVSYRQHVVPILEQRCLACHVAPDGAGYQATGLLMDSYESLMNGTDYGPVIVAGDSRRSILNMLVEGRAGKMQRMPHQEDESLSIEEIEILRDWVNQGALNN
jgi:uncharacterized membrane protein